MTEFAHKRLKEISGGELQRVRLARILAQEPDIILMDEPATHLDIKNKRSLYQLINELCEIWVKRSFIPAMILWILGITAISAF